MKYAFYPALILSLVSFSLVAESGGPISKFLSPLTDVQVEGSTVYFCRHVPTNYSWFVVDYAGADGKNARKISISLEGDQLNTVGFLVNDGSGRGDYRFMQGGHTGVINSVNGLQTILPSTQGASKGNAHLKVGGISYGLVALKGEVPVANRAANSEIIFRNINSLKPFEPPSTPDLNCVPQ